MTEPTNPPEDAKRDLSISMKQANLIGVALFIPAAALLVLPYGALWGWAAFADAMVATLDNLLVTLVVIVGGIVAHEL